ncbi:hypothetical protein BN2497_2127 [Janthinobacterium sp. CG23_2]|nr:hypothetical protein BN2497_2127 [Janthinobacterium sp. CG23_2]CUU27461.1 hypothetical protein BN3177_2127 [Janthinobacterium sp. CG23_2]
MAGTAVAKEAGVESKGKIERKVNLSIIGYNYGKQYINQYWVNGAGGDSLSVSSDSSGGGGIVCCVTLAPTVAPPAVRVRWQYDGCIYLEKSWSPEATKPVEEIYHFTKEVRVTIDPLIPPAPRYIETHFYPDGSVQVALTESISSPRLQLDGERGKNFKYPRCPNDKRPAD